MLQRIEVKLKPNKNLKLTYDYAYPLVCEIYKKISLVDKTFSIDYHQNGLRENNTDRNFKLVVPKLHFSNAKMDKEGISLKDTDTVSLILSGSKLVINKILNGFLIDNKININGDVLEYTEIKSLSRKKIEEISMYKVETSIVETIQNEAGEVQYIDILNPKFVQALKQNLCRKYKMVNKKDYQGKLNIGIEDFSTIKSKAIKIKNHKVRGFGKFNIIIQADKDMQEIAYYCGLGSHNMYGAGFLTHLGGM